MQKPGKTLDLWASRLDTFRAIERFSIEFRKNWNQISHNNGSEERKFRAEPLGMYKEQHGEYAKADLGEGPWGPAIFPPPPLILGKKEK